MGNYKRGPKRIGGISIYTFEELKTELKPIGKFNLFSMKKDIEYLSSTLESNEIIEGCSEAFSGMKNYILVLTNKRLIAVKNKNFGNHFFHEEYRRNEILELTTERVSKGDYVYFSYNNEKVKLSLPRNKNSEAFALKLYKSFSEGRKPTGQSIIPAPDIKTKGSPKVNIQILNGKDQLGYKGTVFQIIQEKAGEIRFKVDYKATSDVFIFLKYERTENIKKSALDVMGWTFAGNMLWGKTGALATGLASQKGTDNSTAALFLREKETKKNIMLIIKCDSKVLSKLSLFIPAQEELQETAAPPENSGDKYEQLEKIGKLKDQGILTDAEFQSEKEKILNS
ncbi:SHOCT domain-containing protein [Halobacillus sp. SY10]|uniref:SHOCT domain-containing protein n=1 Tax=Halobacillus sp. SY10 TaxID=3381356 RepID=UPI0038794E0E